MPSLKDIQTSINKASIYLYELESTIEERQRLVQILKLTPSNNDNYDLINLLERILKHLNYLQDDLNNLATKGEDTEKFEQEFKYLVKNYASLIDELQDDELDVQPYTFELKTIDKPQLVKRDSKSVRFKDNLEDQQVQEQPQQSHQEFENRQQLMGSRAYEPYSDHVNDSSTDVESFDAQSNQQIYAQHQQQLLQQDDDLEFLHQLIRNQHQIGITINSELDDHMIILNDLEQGVDNAAFRLNNARNKLADFRRRCQENGSLVTIVTLTAILILLLVVLN